MLYKSNFAIKPSDFAQLTDGQIAELYYHARDEEGELVLRKSKDGDDEEVATYRDLFVWTWRNRGFTDDQIQERWEKEGYAGRCHPGRANQAERSSGNGAASEGASNDRVS